MLRSRAEDGLAAYKAPPHRLARQAVHRLVNASSCVLLLTGLILIEVISEKS